MPFSQHGNRTFTAISVDKNAPAASGVYGLADARQWIYVGETSNIHAELRRLLERPGPDLQAYRPSGFTFELCPQELRRGRQIQLIDELGPVGNRPMH